MDPTAQASPLDTQAGLDPSNSSPIQPGQFVVSEENKAQASSQTLTSPIEELTAKIPSSEPKPEILPPNASPADQLLQNLAQETGGQTADAKHYFAQEGYQPTQPTTATVPAAPLYEPLPVQQQTEPVAPQTASLSPNTGPDPTPFSSPETMAAPPVPPVSPPPDKLKVVLLGIGAFALIGIIGASVWFFVLNKSPNEDVKTENLASEIEADLPPIPKRNGMGFADLPLPSQYESSPAAQQNRDQSNSSTNAQNALTSSVQQ